MASASARLNQAAPALLPDPVAALPLSPPLASLMQEIWDRAEPPRGTTALIGVDQELQPALIELSEDSTHWQVLGPRRSGKTTLLRNLVLSLAERCSPEEVAFVLVDLMGEFVAHKGKMSLADLPHTLKAVGRSDELPKLVESVEAFLAAAHAEPHPIIVVVIDGYDDGRDELARPMDRLARLVRGRETCDLHFVVASREQIHGDTFYNQVRFAQNAVALRSTDILRDLGDASSALSAGKQKMPTGRGYLVRQEQAKLVQCAVPFDVAALEDADAKRAVADALDSWIERVAQLWPAPAAPIPGFAAVEASDEQPAEARAEANSAPSAMLT
ncbi:MAG: hypothetical protein KDD75_21450, partial [Caldilineaceae bacterium]|nr:hypothetical protein [Caldilineaceae bacterium]